MYNYRFYKFSIQNRFRYRGINISSLRNYRITSMKVFLYSNNYKRHIVTMKLFIFHSWTNSRSILFDSRISVSFFTDKLKIWRASRPQGISIKIQGSLRVHCRSGYKLKVRKWWYEGRVSPCSWSFAASALNR